MTTKPDMAYWLSREDSLSLRIYSQVVVLVILVVLVIVHFPAVGFTDVVQFPLDILEDLVLQRPHFLVPAKQSAITGNEHIKPQKLPFEEALWLFNISERVTFEGSAAVRAHLIKFAIFTLNHFSTPNKEKILKFFLLCYMISYIIRDRNVFSTAIKAFGEMNGKTKTQAEGRQQEEARPLESSTQNQLIRRFDN
jgi:hypothetical protein